MSIKTKVTDQDPLEFINLIDDEIKRADSLRLLEICQRITGKPAKMWGTLIGFDKYHYKSERSRQEGDWPLAAFAPRKAALSIYIMPGLDRYGDLLKDLGKYKIGVGCLYVKRLSDVNIKVLERIIEVGYNDALKQYGSVDK